MRVLGAYSICLLRDFALVMMAVVATPHFPAWALQTFPTVALAVFQMPAAGAIPLNTSYPRLLTADAFTSSQTLKALPTAKTTTASTPKTTRLALPFWQQLPAGATNSIADVAGVQVAHKSYVQEGTNAYRTGLTAVSMLPPAGVAEATVGNTSYPAATYTANGNGECTGTHYINQTGWLNGPIVLTGTRSVGRVWEGVTQAMLEQFGAGGWSSWLPVVCECWDAHEGRNPALTPITPNDVSTLLAPELTKTLSPQASTAAALQQGQTGAGTGMESFGRPAGLGTASRVVSIPTETASPSGKRYTVGVLVNSNHSRPNRLAPWAETALNKPVAQSALNEPVAEEALQKAKQASTILPSALAPLTPEEEHRRQGSIILLLATDAPLRPDQLKAVAQRVSDSIAILGGVRSTSSGEFALAWSTAHPYVDGQTPPALEGVDDATLNQLYQAAMEAGVEAQLNALYR